MAALLAFSSDLSSQVPQALTKAEKVTDMYLDAVKYRLTGNPEKARETLLEAITLNPRHHPSLYELGLIHKQLKQLPEAENYLKQAVDLAPKNIWYKLEYAAVLQMMSKNQMALDVYESISDKVNRRTDLLFEVAMLQMKCNQKREAIETFNKIELLEGPMEQLIMQKYRLYLELEDMEGAENQVKLLIKHYPDQLKYQNQLANFYVFAKKYDQAAALYRKIKSRYPHDPYIDINMADLFRKQQQKDSAFIYLKKGFQNPNLSLNSKIKILSAYYSMEEIYHDQKAQAFTLAEVLVGTHPDESKAYSILGDFYYRDNQIQPATRNFKKAIELDSAGFYNWETYMNLLLQQSAWNELIETGRDAIELFPMQATPYFFAGIGAQQLKKYHEAVSFLKEGIPYVVKNDRLKAQFYTSLGEVYNELKMYEESDISFEKSIELFPDNSYALNNYSYYLSVRNEKLQKAEEYAKQAVRLDPENTANMDTYGWVLFRLGRYEEARFWIEKAVKGDDNPSGEVLEHLGDVFFELNDVDKAVKYWKKALKTGNASEKVEQKIKERIRIQ